MYRLTKKQVKYFKDIVEYLIEKEVPKEPSTEISESGCILFICPNCSEYINPDETPFRCPKCGQRIDYWSNDNDKLDI